MVTVKPLKLRIVLYIHPIARTAYIVEDKIFGVNEQAMWKLPDVQSRFYVECWNWQVKIGRKPARSCKGCTIKCPAMGKYKGRMMWIRGQCHTCDGDKRIKDGPGLGDWIVCPDCHGTGEGPYHVWSR